MATRTAVTRVVAKIVVLTLTAIPRAPWFSSSTHVEVAVADGATVPPVWLLAVLLARMLTVLSSTAMIVIRTLPDVLTLTLNGNGCDALLTHPSLADECGGTFA